MSITRLYTDTGEEVLIFSDGQVIEKNEDDEDIILKRFYDIDLENDDTVIDMQLYPYA